MADGSRCPQDAFRFPVHQTVSRLRPGEITVDLFAGGGGASTAMEQALGRPVDIALNHNPWAVSLHAANHPFTRHLCQDVWEADPRKEAAGRPVGWMHASPDCTHFSQAKGGQPRDRATRSLSWVVLRWAGTVRPRVISLENVVQLLGWTVLVAKRDAATGRVVTLDVVTCARTGKKVNRVADKGERVPVWNQYLVPDKRKLGRTWKQFVAALRALGYDVQWQAMKASDYGAGTSRNRLFMIARCDGQPIVFPAPTHGPKASKPHVTAGDCIDWSIDCPSIFDRERPLADATYRRIAKGAKRFVLESKTPYIVPKEAPMLSALMKFRGDSIGMPATEPLPTITSGAGAARPAGAAHAMGVFTAQLAALSPEGATACAYLDQANGGFYQGAGNDLNDAMSTICATGSLQRLVTASMVTMRGTNTGASITDPVRTMSAGGEHHAVVEYTLSPEHEEGALRVAAFLMRYYGTGGQLGELSNPASTITTKDRLALVTVVVKGTPYVIVDIGMRMLRPHELFKAQGFPESYIIDRTADGRRVSNSRAVAMVGNSVSPPPLYALAMANLDPLAGARAEIEPMKLAA